MPYERPANESDLFTLERFCDTDELERIRTRIKDVIIHHTALDAFGSDETHVILDGAVILRIPGY